MQNKGISKQTLRRLPLYLDYLKVLPDDGRVTISANAIALALDMGEVKVRKDLAAVSTAGRPKVGYLLGDLRRDLERYLYCDSLQRTVLVGAGAWGRALLEYDGFMDYGLHILAAFEREEWLVGTHLNTVPVLPAEEITAFCRENGVHMGILTVPPDAAQECLDAMVQGGVTAVWSFVPTHLNAPQGVLVQQENMAGTLAILTQHLKGNETTDIN